MIIWQLQWLFLVFLWQKFCRYLFFCSYLHIIFHIVPIIFFPYSSCSLLFLPLLTYSVVFPHSSSHFLVCPSRPFLHVFSVFPHLKPRSLKMYKLIASKNFRISLQTIGQYLNIFIFHPGICPNPYGITEVNRWPWCFIPREPPRSRRLCRWRGGSQNGTVRLVDGWWFRVGFSRGDGPSKLM